MPMLKKIVMLAITSGLAKKAWDSYKQKNAVAAGGSERAPWSKRTAVDAGSSESSRPFASRSYGSSTDKPGSGS